MSRIRWLWNGLRDGLHEKLRDHARDEFCIGLRSLGINAELKSRNVAEERVVDRTEGDSLGVIAIASGPIHWVNIRIDAWDTGNDYYADYGVPDARLATTDLSALKVESVKLKGVPLVGKAIGVRWKGEDCGLGILSMLNGNSFINKGLADSKRVEIRAHPASQCWTLTVFIRISNNLFSWVSPPRFIPSLDEWHCYEAIALSLLRANLRPLS